MNKCICNKEAFKNSPHSHWEVTKSGALEKGTNNMIMGECQNCGVIRQLDLHFETPEEFKSYYQNYPPVSEDYGIKNYEHDLALAKKRFIDYEISKDERTLDIGSGSGAYVDYSRSRGVEAYGCEMAQYHCQKSMEHIYKGCFEDLNFPTDYFDSITCHDVLEHVLDPILFLKEAFRVVRQEGKIFLDFPRFHHEAGKHHWKKEHIWYFTKEQLTKIFKETGFEEIKATHPIESKIVVKAIKPKQNRPQIIVPPGIGDVHWVLQKLQSFLKEKNLPLPDIKVLCREDKEYKTHARAFPFIEMYPFVNASWQTKNNTAKKHIWQEAYAQRGDESFPDVLGCDYFMSYNGILEGGYSLEETKYECNSELPRFVSLEEEKARKQAKEKYGKYFLIYLACQGTFKFWWKDFPIEGVVEAINGIAEKSGLTPIFLGASWDNRDSILKSVKKQIPNHVDLIGETTVEQVFGILRGAEFMFGYPSGLSMMAASFGVKTLMLWNDWHRYGFHWNTSPARVKNKTYFIENTKNIDSEILIDKALRIINKIDLVVDPALVKEYEKRTYNYDRQKAVEVFQKYKIRKGSMVLDVDCKAGAFVDECRDNEVEAFGCEELDYDYMVSDKYIYHKNIRDIHFPTDYFDFVFCNETFGYKKEPKLFFEEVFRILKQGGVAVFNRNGFASSNVWFLSPTELKDEFKKVGFAVQEAKNTANKGMLFQLTKPKQKRTSIAFSPGIGDVYWELVKLEAFLRKENISLPDVHVLGTRSKNEKAKPRAFPFIEMFPFLNSTGEVKNLGPKHRADTSIWREAYKQVGRTVFPDTLDCDYFISHNGYLANGYSLDEVDSDLECNWDLERFVSLEESDYMKESIDQYGKYIAIYFSFEGSNKLLLNHIPFTDIIRIVRDIVNETGYTAGFVGAAWDLKDDMLTTLKQEVHEEVDLCGQTSVAQLCGILRGAELVFGIPSGLTILSTMLKKKTIMLWSDWFHHNFPLNTSPPDTYYDSYFPILAKQYKGIQATIDLALGVIYDTVDKIQFEKDLGGRIKVQKVSKKAMPKREVFKTALEKPKEEIKEPIKIPLAKSTRRQRMIPKRNKQAVTTVICVLKSGGDFDVGYVQKLRNMVERNTTIPYKFLCLTDFDIPAEVCDSVKLERNYTGWWSKIELFRKGVIETKRAVYFDLDTVIVGNIDDVLDLKTDFGALQPWNEKNRSMGMCASGMMSWSCNGSGDFSFIYNEFEIKKSKDFPSGDQHYINYSLKKHGTQFEPLQNLVKGIYSYKRNIRGGRLPKDAKIICFHGKPRPNKLMDISWVKNNWK